MSEPKLIRVTLEFENGLKKTLEGKAAQEWSERMSAMAVMEYVHGREFPKFEWKEEKILKDETKQPKAKS